MEKKGGSRNGGENNYKHDSYGHIYCAGTQPGGWAPWTLEVTCVRYPGMSPLTGVDKGRPKTEVERGEVGKPLVDLIFKDKEAASASMGRTHCRTAASSTNGNSRVWEETVDGKLKKESL